MDHIILDCWRSLAWAVIDATFDDYKKAIKMSYSNVPEIRLKGQRKAKEFESWLRSDDIPLRRTYLINKMINEKLDRITNELTTKYDKKPPKVIHDLLRN